MGDMGQVCTTAAYKLRDDGLLGVQYRSLFPIKPMEFAVMEYGQSPVMKMDCSESFRCDFDVEGWEKDDEKDDTWEFGILGTDYDNWHVVYGCADWWDGSGKMYTFMIYGREEEIDQSYIDEAKDAIKAKLPGVSVGPLTMKKGGQGKAYMGLVTCDYEWDHDQ